MKWQIETLAKAREVLRRRAPYFAAGVYRFKPVRVEGLGTLAVDRYQRLYYDPVAIEKWPLFEVASGIVHELLHILDRHMERADAMGVRSDMEAAYWNIAADIALYKLMQGGKWSVKNHLSHETFNFPPGLTVEEYYRLLRQLEDPPPCPAPGTPALGQGNCGSCATGKAAPWEEPAPPDETTSIEQELLRRTVAQAMEAHRKAQGNLPGMYEELLDDMLAMPQIPWQRIFAGMVRSGIHAPGKVDYSRQRPSRRQRSTPNVIRPALVRPVPRVAVVVDTSGSMSRDDLTEAMSEVKGILRATGVSEGVTVLPCDTAVHAVQQVWHPNQVHLVGRGGTAMGEGLREAAKLRPDPSVVVVMTDGYTGWPRIKPTRCPVLVLLVGADKAGLDTVPNWARGLETDS